MSNRVPLLLILGMTLHIAAGAFGQNLRLLGEDPADDGHVDASLIAQHDTWQLGTTVTVGLRLAMDEGWHTYWKNPGDAGMPTSITWDLPEGWAAHGIDWPAPVYFETNGIGGYGYVGTVVLPVRIDVPAAAAEGEVTLKARANWLECADICVAGSADLQLTGTISDNAPAELSDYSELYATAAARQPQALDPSSVEVRELPSGGIEMKLRVPPKSRGLDRPPQPAVLPPPPQFQARFFPDEDDTIDMSAEQSSRFYFGDSIVYITLPASKLGNDVSERLSGVVVIEAVNEKARSLPDLLRVWRIDVPVETP